jgi:tetratricopeptide (TPR) repeat protein
VSARLDALAFVPLVGCMVLWQPLVLAGQANGSQLAPLTTIQEIVDLVGRNDRAGAGVAIERALREHPSDPAVHNLAGVVEAQRGSFDKARAHFEHAIALAPAAPAAYENLGRLYQERSATDPAARGQALDTYRRLLDVAPANAEALFQSALLLAIEGRFGDSLAMISRLPADLRRRSQVLAVETTAQAGAGDAVSAAVGADALAAHSEFTPADVLAVAPAFDHLGDPAVALRMLEALDRRGLASQASRHRLGALYIRAGRSEEALAVLELAAAGRPTVPLLIDLARAAGKAQQHERALGYLGHARALAPDDPQVHFLFGIVCVQMDLVAEAHESLKKAVALAPEVPEVNYAMGSVSLHRRDPSEAVPFFETYVRLVPADPRGRFALGVARFHANDHEGARRELQQVADRPETAAGANYFLARIARQSGEPGEARRAIDASLRANPEYADAWAELGLLQTRDGRFAEAEASLQKALSIAPEHYQATVNLAALYTRTRDPRREQQAAALAALQQKREQYAQELLRMVEVVPR